MGVSCVSFLFCDLYLQFLYEQGLAGTPFLSVFPEKPGFYSGLLLRQKHVDSFLYGSRSDQAVLLSAWFSQILPCP